MHTAPKQRCPLAPRAAVLLASAVAACHPSGTEDSPGARLPDAGSPDAPRHLLLVVVDTLRGDHVGPGGYARETTPHLDRLAARAATFTQCITHSPRTRTAMGALLSGHYPATTGLTEQLAEGPGAKLPWGVMTLGEYLHSAAFTTVAVTSNINVDPTFGFAQGFDRYVALAPREGQDPDRWLAGTTEQVTTEALGQLERFAESAGAGDRLFLYLHYLDPHSPYEPTPEHQAHFDPRTYLVGERTAAEVARYDGEIRMVDAALGRLLGELERLGFADETTVVVTSDHGEEFNDHGGWNHGRTLYDEVVRVPLVLAIPGLFEGVEVDAQVRLVDLVPTLLDLLGLAGRDGLPGGSLLPLLRGEAAGPRPALIEAGSTPLVSLRAPPWKVIVNTETGRTQLFDLERDPGEHHDLSRRRPEVVAELREALESLRADARRRGEAIERDASVELSPEHAERMRALGYLDGDEEEDVDEEGTR